MILPQRASVRKLGKKVWLKGSYLLLEELDSDRKDDIYFPVPYCGNNRDTLAEGTDRHSPLTCLSCSQFPFTYRSLSKQDKFFESPTILQVYSILKPPVLRYYNRPILDWYFKAFK